MSFLLTVLIMEAPLLFNPSRVPPMHNTYRIQGHPRYQGDCYVFVVLEEESVRVLRIRVAASQCLYDRELNENSLVIEFRGRRAAYFPFPFGRAQSYHNDDTVSWFEVLEDILEQLPLTKSHTP